MNKAISTALLLAAGTALANAASVYSNITESLSSGLVAAWNFDSGANPSAGDWTWSSGNFGYTSGSDFGTFGADTTRPLLTGSVSSGGIGLNADSFTISFDLSNLSGGVSTDTTLLSLYTNQQTWSQRSLQIMLSGSTGEITLQVGNIGTNGGWAFGSGEGAARENQVVSLGNVSDYSSADVWKTMTVTSDGKNICVYLDGRLVESLDYSTAEVPLTGIRFGGKNASGTGDGTGVSGNIDNVAIWNTALDADQVKTLVGIPEPSAFGLLAGLGALALVAARRRRSRKA